MRKGPDNLLHKFLSTLFLPVGIILLVFIAAAVTKKRALACLGIFVLFGLSIPLPSNWLLREARPLVSGTVSGDAIVVLSGMLTSSPLAAVGIVSENTVRPVQ